ncbi:hypothetical protein [Arthrobacter sp. NPDC057013]|uniref:hypothetical protein n=1 Tax=Arthrobacter sp. NPDC057013 TaxID=3345999 RepID=UPI00362A162A
MSKAETARLPRNDDQTGRSGRQKSLLRRFAAFLGPWMVTGAADDGPSGIAPVPRRAPPSPTAPGWFTAAVMVVAGSIGVWTTLTGS